MLYHKKTSSLCNSILPNSLESTRLASRVEAYIACEAYAGCRRLRLFCHTVVS